MVRVGLEQKIHPHVHCISLDEVARKKWTKGTSTANPCPARECTDSLYVLIDSCTCMKLQKCTQRNLYNTMHLILHILIVHTYAQTASRSNVDGWLNIRVVDSTTGGCFL